MATPRLRVAFDANVLIAGVRLPRWPYEVLQAAIGGPFDLVLPEQVIVEARRHMRPLELAAFEHLLTNTEPETLPTPTSHAVYANLDLVRSQNDVPIALALLEAAVDILVTNDRDFTDEGATAERFARKVRVMLPAIFLRDVIGWSSEALEAIRNRTWDDVVGDAPT